MRNAKLEGIRMQQYKSFPQPATQEEGTLREAAEEEEEAAEEEAAAEEGHFQPFLFLVKKSQKFEILERESLKSIISLRNHCSPIF